MKVVFTTTAVRHLSDLYNHIADRAGDARADAYVGRLVSYCEGFATFPMRGAARDDLLPGLRVVGFERKAAIAFVVMADAIVIEGVFYGGQDWEGVFASE